jgi:hypothetical protein
LQRLRLALQKPRSADQKLCSTARRRSKRLQDLADAQALLEHHPDLEKTLVDDQRRLLTLLR